MPATSIADADFLSEGAPPPPQRDGLLIRFFYKPEQEEQGTQEAAAGTAETWRVPTFHELCESLARVGTPHAHIAVLAHDLGTRLGEELVTSHKLLFLRQLSTEFGFKLNQTLAPFATQVSLIFLLMMQSSLSFEKAKELINQLTIGSNLV